MFYGMYNVGAQAFGALTPDLLQQKYRQRLALRPCQRFGNNMSSGSGRVGQNAVWRAIYFRLFTCDRICRWRSGSLVRHQCKTRNQRGFLS